MSLRVEESLQILTGQEAPQDILKTYNPTRTELQNKKKIKEFILKQKN